MRILYGMLYGLTAGISFAAACWGYDGYLLSQAHAAYPWLKLFIGVVFCGLAGGAAGWITARFERWLFTSLAWLGVTAFFAWLVVALPLQTIFKLTAWLKPQLRGALHYSPMGELFPRFWLAFAWILIFIFITAILQAPIVESGAFSVSLFGKMMPFLLGIVVMAISGTIADSLTNEPLRSAVLAMDSSIQFVIDNKDIRADPALARANYAGSLNSIRGQVTPARKLIISRYDSFLGQIEIVVEFNDLLASCTVIYAQPANCRPLPGGP